MSSRRGAEPARRVEITPELTLPKLLVETARYYGDGKVAMREKEFGVWRPITWGRYLEECGSWPWG